MKKLNRLLPHYLKQQHLMAGSVLATIQTRWEEVLGPFLSQHIQPMAYEQGILTCYVQHSSLIQEFRYVENEVMRKLQEFLGQTPLHRMKLTSHRPLGNHKAQWQADKNRQTQRKAAFPQQHEQAPDISLRSLREMEQAVAKIEDPQVQDKALRLFKAMERRKHQLLAKGWNVCQHCHMLIEPGTACESCR